MTCYLVRNKGKVITRVCFRSLRFCVSSVNFHRALVCKACNTFAIRMSLIQFSGFLWFISFLPESSPAMRCTVNAPRAIHSTFHKKGKRDTSDLHRPSYTHDTHTLALVLMYSITWWYFSFYGVKYEDDLSSGMLCSAVLEIGRRLRGAYGLHHQGSESLQISTRLHDAASQNTVIFCSITYPCYFTLLKSIFWQWFQTNCIPGPISLLPSVTWAVGLLCWGFCWYL